MKRFFTLVLLFLGVLLNGQQSKSAFDTGEWLKFRLHYGWLNASYATLHVKSSHISGVPVHHVVGRGQTTGFASIFFKVDDTYESYFDKKDGKPYRFIRKINE